MINDIKIERIITNIADQETMNEMDRNDISRYTKYLEEKKSDIIIRNNIINILNKLLTEEKDNDK